MLSKRDNILWFAGAPAALPFSHGLPWPRDGFACFNSTPPSPESEKALPSLPEPISSSSSKFRRLGAAATVFGFLARLPSLCFSLDDAFLFAEAAVAGCLGAIARDEF